MYKEGFDTVWSTWKNKTNMHTVKIITGLLLLQSSKDNQTCVHRIHKLLCVFTCLQLNVFKDNHCLILCNNYLVTLFNQYNCLCTFNQKNKKAWCLSNLLFSQPDVGGKKSSRPNWLSTAFIAKNQTWSYKKNLKKRFKYLEGWRLWRTFCCKTNEEFFLASPVLNCVHFKKYKWGSKSRFIPN